MTVRHAEVLEPDGGLHTRSLRSAKATDSYVLADDGETVLEPSFTFHGFRYAEVTTGAELVAAEVLAISSDTPPRGTFDCSDPALTRFHENVRWSQRDNFVAVPTDCPQRDERLGWTGDAQAFAPTACTLFDSRAFWESWLIDLAHDQTADGAVPSVVPNVLGDGPSALGRAGWADAATIVPWAVHVAYADTEVLAAQLPSMRALVSYLQARRQDDGLLGGEFQFGDWLDPDAPGDRPHEAKTSSDYLANAFFAHSARLVARAATVLGDAELGRTDTALADDVASRTWTRWREHALTTQTGCAVALELGIAPAAAEAEVGRALAGLVRDAGGRIATGFLGTPLVLPALTRTGHLAEAYLMLLRHELPSWLYQVDRGATTVWERWDAIRADGSIHDGVMHMPNGDSQMLSFNHYAYGAVVDWVYRHARRSRPGPGRARLPARRAGPAAGGRDRPGQRVGRDRARAGRRRLGHRRRHVHGDVPAAVRDDRHAAAAGRAGLGGECRRPGGRRLRHTGTGRASGQRDEGGHRQPDPAEPPVRRCSCQGCGIGRGEARARL